jgi:3-phosphoshikimate 1-carboxyvinyltransferase
MSDWRVDPAESVRGEMTVNGDKSVSHRALLIGALSDQPVRVVGFGASADTGATLDAVRALGVRIDDCDAAIVVHGVGLRGLQAPSTPIDVANSGTLIRLLAGLLAGQKHGTFLLDGDASIRRRPMERVAAPLRSMGAAITTSDGYAPITIRAGSPLAGITYTPPVASAQVKSALLLAGLNARSPTTIIEAVATRDHTERLLRAAGVAISRDASAIQLHPPQHLSLREIDVPGDISSAAFFITAATLLAGSALHLRGVGVNPGRTGILTVLERMGGRVGVYNRRTTAGGEPLADIEVRPAELVAVELEPALVPLLVDELPLVALLAACARGETVIRGAEDLRHKESDRINAVAAALANCGAHIEETGDGWRIRGVPSRLRGGLVDSRGDHRIAMLGAIAGLYSEQGVRVRGADCIDVSFPEFRRLLRAVTSIRDADQW